MRLLNEYLRENFGCKVYKLSLQAKVTCPNRDGTIGTGGCIFCSRGGSGEFAADVSKPVSEQLKEAKKRVAGKVKGACKYIAYFQSFTNTYGDAEYLKNIFDQAISDEDIVVLSIATRPDCISEEMYEILSGLNRIKPVWIELGLQTIHEDTARYIRRGYPLEAYDDCVRRLSALNLSVITHVILGLPGENEERMLETVKYVVSSGVQGIKLQLLHVLRGTDLEKDYADGKFQTMSLEAYVSLLKKIIPLIPDDVVIHRLTGDGPKRLLIAPLWSADKKKVINTIRREVLAQYPAHDAH